jgi:hypothetical protein
MTRREIPLPVAIGIIMVLIVAVMVIFWRKTSPPTQETLETWAPYPQIPSQQGTAPQTPR